jgi:prolyl-tRNA editing enzyme YbaK/EbsC (Cys-tRNA(Pro) deacylase)
MPDVPDVPDDLPDPAQHPRVLTVAATLERLGATGRVRVLSGSARTAPEAAAALGVDVGAIVNSLVFDAGGKAVLVLTSGVHRVDTAYVAEQHGLPRLDRATPDFVRRHTGQAIGGVSPVGHPAPVRTLVDTWLSTHPVVWAAAGHPYAVFPTTYAELLGLTGGTPAGVAR